MLALGDQVDQRLDVERAPAERMGRDLAVEDQRGDVGVVGRDLAPALGAVVGPDAQQPEVRVLKVSMLVMRMPTRSRRARRRRPLRR